MKAVMAGSSTIKTLLFHVPVHVHAVFADLKDFHLTCINVTEKMLSVINVLHESVLLNKCV